MRALVHEALRMQGRLIVGETRGDEVIPLLKALSSGDDGSMCTIHASSSANVFQRFALYAAMAPERFPHHVTAALLAQSIDFVVFMTWDGGTPSQRRQHQGDVHGTW